MTQISRRLFLGALGTGAAGVVASSAFDPERLLWVPGAKTLFLPPQRTLVQARTLQEALSKGLAAVFPDGSQMQISLSSSGTHSRDPHRARLGWQGMTLAEWVQHEIQGIEYMGGRVVKVADQAVGWPNGRISGYEEWGDGERFRS